MTPPRPAGYPSEWESVARLADGRVVEIRPIVPDDADELGEAIRTADAETLHLRFLGSPPPVTPELLTRLTTVDYVTRFALIARAGGRGVAIARYETLLSADPSDTAPVSAEVAAAVRPEWRGVGLATALIEQLARRAQTCGITHFCALYSAANRPVAELARQAHAHVVIDAGSAELDARIGAVVGPNAGTDAP
jgi:GNAT superfamily N-acetyltransferase